MEEGSPRWELVSFSPLLRTQYTLNSNPILLAMQTNQDTRKYGKQGASGHLST